MNSLTRQNKSENGSQYLIVDKNKVMSGDKNETILFTESNDGNTESNQPNNSHISEIKHSRQTMDSKLDSRTQDYLKKIEYKRALEQQILEKNLKKKHEKDIRVLEEKLDDLKETIINRKTNEVPLKSGRYFPKNTKNTPVVANCSSATDKPHQHSKFELSRMDSRANSLERPWSILNLKEDSHIKTRDILKSGNYSNIKQ